LGAGVALGLAFMLKGPVAWVQTLAPVVIYAIVRHFRSQPEERGRGLPWVMPILAATLMMLAVALPWYFYVLHMMPGGRKIWEQEIVVERGEKPSSVLGYLAFLPYLLPWTICFIGGIINARRGM